MCTVCGIFTDEPDSRNVPHVLEMLRLTRHRGPDACGYHADGVTLHAASPDELELQAASRPAASVVLAQSRLAITGSMAARQPMASWDGRLALSHNGEVYNHESLVTILRDPTRAASGCDSEVLMGLLEEAYAGAEGDLAEAMRRTVAFASGMYALAATDGESVVLARDAIGKKPLYYVDARGCLAWASERKALAGVASEHDAKILPLPPGHMLVRRRGEASVVECVERLAAPAVDVTEPGVALALYEGALDRAVRRRTAGLTRAAVFFSGGVDSVLVARMLQRAGVEPTCYVVGAEGSSDVAYALEVAQEMGLDVRLTLVDEDLVEAWLPRILAATELNGPMMVEVSVPMWFAAKAAHEDGHRVVFTGQAADELWAGYEWYRGVVERHGHATLHGRLWEDVRALPADCLEREDRISMAWSLEMRAPFLDADVIRAAMRVSPRVKLEGSEDTLGKRPHRALAARVGVPERVAYRTKVPAQDGASIHELLERIARRAFPREPPASDVVDFGSNYRYRDAPGSYGSPRVRALLARIVAENGILVAGPDGSATAPARRVRVKGRADGALARP